MRLALVPVFFYFLIIEAYLAAFIVLAVAGLTDFLDGFFARRWNQVTRLGQLLDPAADRLFIFSTLIGLSITGLIPAWFAVVIIARDLLLLLTYPILATHGYGALPVHYLGKAATFALLYAFPLLMLANVWPAAAFVIQPLGWAFAWWGIGLYWWAGVIYLIEVVRIVNSTPRATR